MNTIFNCSYVIAYTHSSKNLKNLKFIISILEKDPRIQIIIIESGKFPRIKNLDLKSDYTFVESNQWNIGWSFNCGFKKAKSENLFFATFEFLPRLEIMHNILINQDTKHCIYLQDSIIEMSSDQTTNRIFDESSPKKDIKHTGVTYYRTDSFKSIGGYDENIIGDGLYVLQNHKNKLFLGVGHVNNASAFKFSCDILEFKKDILDYNKNHIEKILDLDKDRLSNYIRVQSKKNGNYNKYEKDEVMDYDV